MYEVSKQLTCYSTKLITHTYKNQKNNILGKNHHFTLIIVVIHLEAIIYDKIYIVRFMFLRIIYLVSSVEQTITNTIFLFVYTVIIFLYLR